MHIQTPAEVGLPPKFDKWRTNQSEAISVMITPGRRCKALSMPTGCHEPGQGILRYDGRVEQVEYLSVGDLLMGPDGQPREIIKLINGEGSMYTVAPVKGNPFVVNADHVLSLRRTNDGKTRLGGTAVMITVGDYIAQTSNTFRHLHKLYRTAVDFAQPTSLPLDPYFLGVLLGDGCLTSGIDVCKPDAEIIHEVKHQAEVFGLEFTTNGKDSTISTGPRSGRTRNPITTILRTLNLFGCTAAHKFIPTPYLNSTRQSRLDILAGLLDTDGSLVATTCYDFISKSSHLARDIAYVSRSLGLAAYITPCLKSCQNAHTGLYYRVSISGNTHEIPCRIPRKQADSRRQIKDVLNTGLSVSYNGVGEYFGFTLSGDGLYMLDDFTVTHNSGKSPAYIAAALLSKLPTCVVTNSKGLQNQLMSDFESIGLVDIRGRANYVCDLRPGYSCEEGHATRCPYKGTAGCPSDLAEMRATASNLVVTNYSKWCAAKRFTGGLGHFEQVIFDEAHNMHGALANAMQVILNYHEIEANLKMDFLSNPEAKEFSNWKLWAAEARAAAEIAMQSAKHRLESVSDPKTSWVRQFTHMRGLSRRLATLATANPKEWIVDEIQDGYQFDPIRPAKYAESALFFKIPRIICVSATLRPKTMFMVGLGRTDFEFHEFPSDFDPKRCPVYYIPTMRVDKNHPDLRMLWVKLDQIAAKRRDRNGIVHTISYARRDEILQSSRFASSMIINQKGEPPKIMLDQFAASYPGAILVSPSVGTGYDFAGRAAEWQFISKIPFPDSRSKIVQARQDDDKEYGPYSAMQEFVQATGRIMRSKEDRGETFIGDENLSWFLPRYGHLAPKSFHGFLRQVQTVPEPPERL